MKNIINTLALGIMVSLASCGELPNEANEEEEESSAITEPDDPTGTWVEDCEEWGTGGKQLALEWNHTALTYSSHINIYADAGCASLDSTSTFSYTYTQGAKITTGGVDSVDGRTYTLVFKAITRTVKNAAKVTSDNTDRYCGKSDWVLDETTTLVGLSCGVTEDTIGNETDTIYAIDGDTMYEGSIYEVYRKQ